MDTAGGLYVFSPQHCELISATLLLCSVADYCIVNSSTPILFQHYHISLRETAVWNLLSD